MTSSRFPSFPCERGYLLACLWASLLAWPALGAEGSPLDRLEAWNKNPDTCERTALLQYLGHEDIRVRSAARDLLESVTGKDFGLDPWLEPQQVPQQVRQELEAWAHAGESLGSAGQEPTPGQLQEAIALLRTADPDTQRRICLRFSRHRAIFTAALQQELDKGGADHGASPLSEKERDRLRCAQFRAQLQGGGLADAGQVAALLTSHARTDTLAGLEQLRRAGKEALPVLMQYVGRQQDVLIREVAVDVLMELGGLPAFHALQPLLMEEQDRNILQIAARRSADCTADPALIAFLNQCALSADEDIALAGLEALGALSANRDDEDPFSDGDEPAAARKDKQKGGLELSALPADAYIRLLESPFWRVRAAALAALRSTVPFLPSLYDAGLQDAILARLQDEDETVRQNAIEVIYKRKLSRLRSRDLESFALRTPTYAPSILYQFCAAGLPLSPAMLELPTRFDARQVEQLAAYDEEYDTLFATSRPEKPAMAVLERLMQNPDPRVRRQLMEWCGEYLHGMKDEWAAAYRAWLMDAHVPEPDRGRAMTRLLRRFSNDIKRDETYGRLCADGTFTEWVLQEARRAPADKEYSRNICLLAALLSPQEFAPMAAAALHQLDTDSIELLLRKTPQIFLNADAATLGYLFSKHGNLCDLLAETLAKDEQGVQALTRLELDDAAWANFMRLAANYRDSSSSKGTDRWLLPLLQRAMETAPGTQRRAEAAYLYLSHYHSPEAEENELPAILQDTLRSLPAEQAEALECLRSAPLQAGEVEAWARRFAASRYASVRFSVASCLLPLDGWCFYLPPTAGGEEKDGPDVPPPMKRQGRLQRVSCPASLLALVRRMQQDEDAHVALMACASILYRTGDCDQSRMKELLLLMKKELTAAKEAKKDQLPTPLRFLWGEALGQVWRRWYEYRGSTEEPFKLKGNPKQLKPGVLPLLQQLRDISNETWGIQDFLKKQLGDKDRSTLAGQLLPHEFHFQPPARQEDNATPSPRQEEAATGEAPAHAEDEGDAPDPQPLDLAAPVRLEFFHQKGCDTCARVQERLTALKEAYPGLQVADYDIASDEGYERNDVLCQRFGLARLERHKAPAVFAEGGYLLGENAAGPALADLIELSLARGQQGNLSRLGNTAPANPEESADPAAQAPATDEQAADNPAAGTPATPRSEMLAAATAQEQQQAAASRFGENLRRYGLLGAGAALVLFSLSLLLFSRRKK